VDIVKKGTVSMKVRTKIITILVVNSESFLPSLDSSGSPPGGKFWLGV